MTRHEPAIRPTTVVIHVDGKALRSAVGSSVAAALLDAGIGTFRRSVSGEARAPLCGMGICFECRITVDGVAHRRACLITVAEGMRISTASTVDADGAER